MTAPASPPRSAAAPRHWGAEALWESLVPVLPGLSIEVVERIDSTNSELAERLRRSARMQQPGHSERREGGRQDDLSPQLLVANHQTAGRGRMGRRWHSTPGSSLTFSLALPLARADWSGLSLAVGLAVVEALDPEGRRLGLKWPNDLVLRDAPGAPPPPAEGLADEPPATGRKLGGILIESVPVGVRRVAVICHTHPQQGGTMDNKVVQTLARAFLQLGYRAVRFNFRGIGQSGGEWDEGRGEIDDASAVLAAFRETGLPLAVAGFSFGGYVASHAVSRLHEDARAERLILVGPATRNFQVAAVPQDTVVIHGEADDVVPLQSTLDWARPQSLPVIVIPGVKKGAFILGAKYGRGFLTCRKGRVGWSAPRSGRVRCQVIASAEPPAPMTNASAPVSAK